MTQQDGNDGRFTTPRMTQGMTGSARPTSKFSSRLALVALAGGSVLLVAAGGAFANAAVVSAQQSLLATPQSGAQSGPQSGTHGAPGTTTVTPAGAAFQGNLSANTTASFSTGRAKLTCSQSNIEGKVPQAPGNVSASGGVSLAISAPTFSDCPTGNPLAPKASVSTNSDNGAWSLALRNDPAGPKGTITIPKAGIVGKVSGLISCEITVAPNGPITITGDWIPGSGGMAPKLSIHATNVAMKVTGSSVCPKGKTSGDFTATYDLTGTTKPGSAITVK